MFNVLLDPLPTEYKGFPIDSDFQTGIQIMQALEDEELTQQEQIGTALSLLYVSEPPDIQTAIDGLMWFLTDWNHDHNSKTDKARVTDYDIDQWRIYSAFRQHYGINLNDLGVRCVGYEVIEEEIEEKIEKKIVPIYEENKMHFWEFMGLLTTLPECAYTRVIDIRAKKITNKMGKDEKKAYEDLKKVYSIEQKKQVKYTEEQIQAIDEYDRMIEKQKEIRKRKKEEEEIFKVLNNLR